MSHGYTTTKWVRENLPELEARGSQLAIKVIAQAIRDTKAKRFFAVLFTILVPAVVVNVYHAEITSILGGALSRVGLLSISVVVSAIAASKWSRKILYDRITWLASNQW